MTALDVAYEHTAPTEADALGRMIESMNAFEDGTSTRELMYAELHDIKHRYELARRPR